MPTNLDFSKHYQVYMRTPMPLAAPAPASGFLLVCVDLAAGRLIDGAFRITVDSL
jgi:hypothetical protein